MSRNENINVVKHAYTALLNGDTATLRKCLTDDVQWFSIGPPDIIPTAGTWKGREQVLRYFATLEVDEELERFEPREFIAFGDKVVAIGVAERYVKSTGSMISSPWVHVFTVHQGRISECRSFYDTAAAVAALKGRGARVGTASAA